MPASVDVNADGFKDLIVLNNTDGTVSILLADGLGGFAAPITAPVGASPTSLVVADFNGDGKPDIAATANGDNSVSILYGAGTGVFSSGPAISTIGSPIAIAMGDLNNDGKIDILLDGSATEALQVLPGRPNGIFGFLNSMSAEPIASVAADFNEDGKVDLAVLNTDAKIDVLLGNGQGLFTSGSQLSANTGPSAIAVADLNNDGHQD